MVVMVWSMNEKRPVSSHPTNDVYRYGLAVRAPTCPCPPDDDTVLPGGSRERHHHPINDKEQSRPTVQNGSSKACVVCYFDCLLTCLPFIVYRPFACLFVLLLTRTTPRRTDQTMTKRTSSSSSSSLAASSSNQRRRKTTRVHNNNNKNDKNYHNNDKNNDTATFTGVVHSNIMTTVDPVLFPIGTKVRKASSLIS